VAGLVAALRAGGDAEILLLRFLVRGQYLADAGAVHGDWLLGEDVLALLDRVLNVLRPEAGGRRQQDDVDAAVDDLLIGVEADEAAVVGQVDAVVAILHLLALADVDKAIAAALEAVLEGVAQSVEDEVRRGVQAVIGRTAAAAAAADQ